MEANEKSPGPLGHRGACTAHGLRHQHHDRRTQMSFYSDAGTEKISLQLTSKLLVNKRPTASAHPARAQPIDVMNELNHPIARMPELVERLYALVGELEPLFPGRKFTPDGHLVGSLGEVIAAHRYGLKLYPASTLAHDGLAPNGRCVEVKATQGTSVALRAEPEHLIVLQLAKSGAATEVYNGPGHLAWHRAGSMQKNGQRPISLFQLRKLMSEVLPEHRIPTTNDA